MESKNNLPTLKSTLLVISGLIMVIFILMTVIKNHRIDSKIKDKKIDAKRIERKIDSITDYQSDLIETVSNESKTDVKNAKKLIKKLPNEKINIPNADYDSMCKYISNYSPN